MLEALGGLIGLELVAFWLIGGAMLMISALWNGLTGQKSGRWK